MPLPPSAKGHHTVWVHTPGRPARAIRYAVDGDRLVGFGDDALSEVPDGTRVSAAIHEIAGGPALDEFAATLRVVDGSEVSASALHELLEHVPLGRTAAEVERTFDHHRSNRRVVALVP